MRPHALCVVHGVHDLVAAERFFADALALPARARGAGWVLVDNASVAIRLVESDSVGADLTIQLVGRELSSLADKLLTMDGVTPLRPLQWVSTWRQELSLQCPFGVQMLLACEYDEDQLGVVPPLPTSLEWDPATEALIQDLLRHVPVVLRNDARRFVTEGAEERALADGRVVVKQNEAVDVLVQRTPSFQLERLREELGQRGLEPQRWAASFVRGEP